YVTNHLAVFAGAVLAVTLAATPSAMTVGPCAGLPTKADLQTFLQHAATNTGVSALLTGGASGTCSHGAVLTAAGCVDGLFGGTRVSGVVVKPHGQSL